MKKKLFSLLAFLMVMLTLNARTDTVHVCSTPAWLEKNVNLVDTLSDGTIIYFYRSSNTANAKVRGAKGSASSLILPDSVLYSDNNVVVGLRYDYGYPDGVNYDSMPNLTELTLPATITELDCDIPSTITDLHLLYNGVVKHYSKNRISYTTNVWVPYSAISQYRNAQSSGSNYWSGAHNVHYEGWQSRALSIYVPVAGTFAQVIVDSIDQWYEVNELTVSGHLNATDYTYFNRLTEMTKLDLSQTDIITIGGLSGLTMLNEVILSTSVVNIEESAFEDCNGLQNINMPNVTTINDYAFFNCSDLVIDNLPSLVTVGEYAFSYCSSIQNMSLPVAETINNRAFYGCFNLKTFSAPEVLSIKGSAFSDCSDLDSIYLPKAKTIGSYAFSGCNLLKSTYIPEVTSLYASAFSYCTSLQSIDLPNVSSIDNSAFSSCNSLSSISISSNLKTLGSSVFSSTTSLRDVFCYATTPVSTNSFPSSVVSNATLHVPAYSVNSYLAHSDWYRFKNIVPLDTTVDKLIINTDFILTTQNGLTDTIDMEITRTGRLTVRTDSTLNISKYIQACTPLYKYSNDYTECSSLIVHDTITADTVTFKVSVKKNTWNFLSFPVDIDVFDIDVPSGTGWVIRKYSGEDRANLTGNTWQDVTDGMTLNAGQGYIFNCTNSNSSDTYIEFTLRALDNGNKNKIFETGNASQFLNTYVSDLPHNSSWNLVGNPYPCFFNSDSIQHNGVITVWNGSGYTAYSLIDDHYCFRPFEAFFVQCPENANAMIFRNGGRTDTYTQPTQILNAPAFTTFADNNSRLVYNLKLSNDSASDRTRFVLNENASLDYEISSDASKFLSGDNVTPQIYVMENGQRFAIDERPYANGQIDLGIYIAQPGQYTISLMSNPNDGKYPILTDKLNGERTNLANANYQFQATAGFNDERFMITFEEIPAGMEDQTEDVTYLEEGDVYTMDGRFVMHIDSRYELQNLMSGVYVIKNENRMEKIAIK